MRISDWSSDVCSSDLLPIAAAHCCKKVLHNLDIFLSTHRDLSISLISDRVASVIQPISTFKATSQVPPPIAAAMLPEPMMLIVLRCIILMSGGCSLRPGPLPSAHQPAGK